MTPTRHRIKTPLRNTMTDVKIPALGESIASGIISGWQVADGDFVQKDQILFELETDKITQEMQAEVAGVISLKAADGDEVEVGAVVATIDESVSESSDASDAGKANEAAANGAAATDRHPAVSPAVRRIASETGIDPHEVTGTGKDGRVTKGDMLEARAGLEQRTKDEDAARASASTRLSPDLKAVSRPPFKVPGPTVDLAADQPAVSARRTTRQKMSPLRRKIAERLVNASTEAALLTTFNECDMSAVMGLRKRYQEEFVASNGIKLGFMSFFVKATVEALKAVPGINAQIDGSEIVTNHYYDIGVAVGTDKGLIVPVIRDCDSKSFARIEQDIADKAKAARTGKLSLDDLAGGVFTISNGGIYGSMLSTPLLNMPQSGILGLHNIQERPVAINGEVVVRPMMYLALSYDHRLVDGKEAVTFLVKVKQLIEDPARFLFNI